MKKLIVCLGLSTTLLTACRAVVVEPGPLPPPRPVYAVDVPVWELELRERARLEGWREPYLRGEILRRHEYEAGRYRWRYHP